MNKFLVFICFVLAFSTKGIGKETTYSKELFDKALSDGKVVVLSSWIKYCTSCASQMKILEKAKQHLKQYSYREVANWLSTFTDRYISHIGLMKRVKREQRRKNKARTLRDWSEYAEKAIQAAQKLDEQRTGSRA